MGESQKRFNHRKIKNHLLERVTIFSAVCYLKLHIDNRNIHFTDMEGLPNNKLKLLFFEQSISNEPENAILFCEQMFVFIMLKGLYDDIFYPK